MSNEEITGSFYEKEWQKTCQKEFIIEALINCMSNGKVMIIVLIVGLIKKILYKNESILF